MKKILMLGNSYLVIFKFRGELIQRLVKEGYDVYVSFPNGPFGEGKKAEEQFGVHFIETKIERHGKNPLKDFELIKSYKSIVKKVKPDVILSFTVKPNIYGGFVAKKYHIPFFPNITGLGTGLISKGFTGFITKKMYKRAMKASNCVFFQNSNDISFFKENRLLCGEYKLLPGSGVNLKKFQFTPINTDFPRVFLYIGRVMKAKGIEEFFETAKKCKDENTEFHICGFCEEDYREELQKLEKENIIIYHGLVDDVKPFVQNAHCIVLPSFHPEGISNVLLEAAASGRLIITTDHPGCRETVDDGSTGFVIPVKDSQACIEAVKKVQRMSLNEIEEMGKRARKKMEKSFSRDIVVEAYMAELRGLDI